MAVGWIFLKTFFYLAITPTSHIGSVYKLPISDKFTKSICFVLNSISAFWRNRKIPNDKQSWPDLTLYRKLLNRSGSPDKKKRKIKRSRKNLILINLVKFVNLNVIKCWSKSGTHVWFESFKFRFLLYNMFCLKCMLSFGFRILFHSFIWNIYRLKKISLYCTIINQLSWG
jgi:hypothetical protein